LGQFFTNVSPIMAKYFFGLITNDDATSENIPL
jgi:hypothetical protein